MSLEQSAAIHDKRGPFALFDAIRFFAAIVVVIEHSRTLLMLDYASGAMSYPLKAFYFFTRFGHEAVLVFFVLSGFWIASVVDRRSGDRDFWSHYLIDRCSRLLVVIVPALLFGGLLDGIGLHLLHGAAYEGRLDTEALPVNIGPALRPEVLFGNMVFLQTILVPNFGTNGPLWSLANEFWYYLWFPALFVLVKRRQFTWALLSLAVVLVAPRLAELFPAWLLGAALYLADKHGLTGAENAPVRTSSGWIWAGLLAASLVIARVGVLPMAGSDILVALAFTGWLSILLRLRATAPAWLLPLSRYGAGSSFALYASHYPVLAMIATLVNGEARRAPGLGAAALTLLVAVVCVGWGYVFSQATEAHTGGIRGWIKASAAVRRLVRV